jgi:hypothetical protein
MSEFLSALCVLLVAVAMGLCLAHALELPGKHRLDDMTYRAVQAIYYPGFTIGGFVGEFGGMLALATLMLLTPPGSAKFGWIGGALGLLIAAHATYWLVTHPSNSAWLKQTHLTGAAKLFFGAFSANSDDWRRMRKTWEYSHVVRACLATLSLVCIIAAVVD